MISILIVEDEAPIRELLRISLKEAGYECTCAGDGDEAADILIQKRFDLVLLDIMLPGANGYELLEFVRPMEIPVIFLTAKGEVADKVKGLRMGAEDYITKPFELAELLARVETVLRRYHKAEMCIRDRDKHDTIGIDAVAMCVNDIACAGGEPLFFLDYIACGKNYPEKIAAIVSGVAEGCLQSEAALIGGETAEHPGLMPEDDYDLAGFAVGVCDKKDMITGEHLKAGDVLIGMASSGVHSNGFSLVRKVFEMTKESLDTQYDCLGCTLGEALLAPTRIYVKALKSIKEAGVTVKACSHITGGGFYENIPRMLIEGTHAVIEKNSYPVPPIFGLLAEKGEIAEQMMYNTFNMGLGMVLAVDAADVDKTMEAIKAAGDAPYVVGRIEAGEKGVTLC